MRYWKRVDEDGNTTTVESYSHSLKIKGAVKITEQEFNDYLASLPEPLPPEPPRDLAAEIDELRARIDELRARLEN